MTRAGRRHHAQRLKNNRRFYYGRDLAYDPRELGRTVNTATRCSRPACGNPRKHFGERTIQELRVLQRHAEF